MRKLLALLAFILTAALAAGADPVGDADSPAAKQAFDKDMEPYAAKNWGAAATSLRGFIDAHPQSEYLDDALRSRFQALGKSEDGDGALEALKEFQTLRPQSPLLEDLMFFLTGQKCSQLSKAGQTAEARETLKTFEQKFPATPHAYHLRQMEANSWKNEAEALRRSGKIEEAQACEQKRTAAQEAALSAITALLAKADADANLKAKAKAHRMHLYYECGKFSEMLTESQSRLAQNPQMDADRASLLVWQGVAKACQKPRDLEGAKQALDAAIAASKTLQVPADNAEFFTCLTDGLAWRVWIAREQKDAAKAKECLSLLRSKMPESNAKATALERFQALEAQ